MLKSRKLRMSITAALYVAE